MLGNDFTQIALSVVQQATGEKAKAEPTPKQKAGRKGGLKGGKTRMGSLTKDQRLELAAKGVAARKEAQANKARASASSR